MPAEPSDAAPLEVDYLVIGAGAMGMAFVDTLLTETDATVAIVDRYDQPGGHWTRAYPFVRLHQPSVFYGVNSRELGTGAVDTAGLNAGLHELATGDEVLTYFDDVMRKTFLASGRVAYFPMSNHDGPAEDRPGVERFSSLVTGRTTDVVVRRRVVDATYMNVTVPSMTTPRYAVAAGVRVIPPNDLVALRERPAHVTVVGSGKTGIDACLWLLQHGVDPADISWIVPRDAWLFDRARIQPGPPTAPEPGGAGPDPSLGSGAADQLIAALESGGLVMRLAPDVVPTAFRCATVTRAELDELRRIDDVLRHGRVTAIDVDRIEFGDVTVPALPGTLYVDCTADGLEPRPPVPIFDGPRMTLQAVIPCQQVFSASLAAYVEASYDGDDVKNELCEPGPHPSTHLDLAKYMLDIGTRTRRWSADPELRAWISTARSVVRVPDDESLQTDEGAAFIRDALAEAGAPVA